MSYDVIRQSESFRAMSGTTHESVPCRNGRVVIDATAFVNGPGETYQPVTVKRLPRDGREQLTSSNIWHYCWNCMPGR